MRIQNPTIKAFENPIHKLTQAPILTHYNLKKPVIIKTDTSKFDRVGIISPPGDDEMLRPIVYTAKSMSRSEYNYNVHDKELLAIILVLEDWRRYFKGNRHLLQSSSLRMILVAGNYLVR